MMSITIQEGKAQYVLPCRYHNFGTKLFIIYPCRQPVHIPPTDRPNQLCHAVIPSRTIKHMKSSQHSTQFRMHEQRGTFNGIGTCSINMYGHFDFTSNASGELQSRSVCEHPNINALLTNPRREKSYPNSVQIRNVMKQRGSPIIY